MGAPEPTKDTPRTVGDYEIAGRIASGGMAHVYVARKIGARGRPVALKRPRGDLDDEGFQTMFLDEARLAFQIHSVHCVEILEVGRDHAGVPFYVMPLIVGAPISKIASETPVGARLAVEIAAQAALGLHDAHRATDTRGNALSIVHRDVSPQNVLVDVEGRVRVADFGVARAAQRSVRTRTGQVKGKVGYLSPEQAQARPVDARSDVFSLGIVLWEMLTHERLFRARDLVEQHRRLLVAPIPHPSDVAADVPRAVGDVVMAALERDPERRLRDAVTFEERLRDAMPGRVEAHELGRFVSTAVHVEVERLREIAERVARHDDTILGLELPGVVGDDEETTTSVRGEGWAADTELTPKAPSVEPPTKSLGLRALLSRLTGRK